MVSVEHLLGLNGFGEICGFTLFVLVAISFFPFSVCE
jgi:hypothetical protein